MSGLSSGLKVPGPRVLTFLLWPTHSLTPSTPAQAQRSHRVSERDREAEWRQDKESGDSVCPHTWACSASALWPKRPLTRSLLGKGKPR